MIRKQDSFLGFPKNSRAPEVAGKGRRAIVPNDLLYPAAPGGRLTQYLGLAKRLIERGPDYLAGAGHMPADEIACPSRVPAFQRPKNQSVLLDRFGPAGIGQKRLVARATNPSDQARVKRDNLLIAREPDDRLMQGLIVAKIGVAILGDVPPFDAALQLAQSLEVRSRHSDRRQLRGEALDATQGFEQVHELPNRQLRHVGAPSRHELDQSFSGENLQRFAQRSPRNLKLLAELRFVDPFARRQPSLDDHVANPLGGFIMERPPADRYRRVGLLR